MSLSPSALSEARKGADTRTQRLIMGLHGLSVLAVLLPLLMALWSFLLWKTVSPLADTLWQEIVKDQPQLGDLGGLTLLLWLVGALFALLVGTEVWFYQIIRAAVAALRDQLLTPSPAHAQAFVRAAKSLRPWITLTQWFPVVIAAFQVLMGIVGVMSASSFGQTSTDNFDLWVLLPQMIPTFAVSIIQPVLIWLILASLKRWLDAVVSTVGGKSQPILPAAQSMSGWLVLVLALTCLQLASTVFGSIFSLAGPLLLRSFAPELEIPAQYAALFSQIMVSMGFILIVKAISTGINAVCIASLRGLSEDVARLLDPAPALASSQTAEW